MRTLLVTACLALVCVAAHSASISPEQQLKLVASRFVKSLSAKYSNIKGHGPNGGNGGEHGGEHGGGHNGGQHGGHHEDPCACTADHCGCCYTFNLGPFGTHTSCGEVGFNSNNQTLWYKVTFNGQKILGHELGEGDPPKECAPVPLLPLLHVCLDFYDTMIGAEASGCADSSMKVVFEDYEEEFGHAHIGCFHFTGEQPEPKASRTLRLLEALLHKQKK